MHRVLIAFSLMAGLFGADPTFLRRRVSEAPVKPDELTAGAERAAYQPLLGAGDAQAGQLKGIARYGVLSIDAGGQSAVVQYAGEEQIYFVLEGGGTLIYGAEKAALARGDFAYMPVGVPHGVRNDSARAVRILVMGFRIPDGVRVPPTSGLMKANVSEVALTELASHGPTTKFQLLMGATDSKRDKLAAAQQMVSLFIMDFAPGGTNIPHHHDSEEEIYYILRGHGDMVAGGGADGNEGRYAAQAGDAYFLRLNTTVGFYSAAKEGEAHDLVLAVRSKYPFRTVR